MSESLIDQPVATSTDRIAALTEALRKVVPLQGLTDEEYLWLAHNGTERFADANTTLFEQGEPADHMMILLKGEVQVQRDRSGASPAMFIGRAGQMTGLLPFSRMQTWGGRGITNAPSWAVVYHRSIFPRMLAAIPSMTQRVVSILLDRSREVTRMEQQSEKLTALGKLAGNLAHELNNPASAAQRAASGMLQELEIFGRERFRLGSLCFQPEHVEALREWDEHMRRSLQGKPTLTPAQVAIREEALVGWLQQRQIGNIGQIAPEFAEAGITPEHLAALPDFLTPESTALLLSQHASTLRAESMAEAMLDSTARIFDLIRAIKDYSYMDQAPIQDIDVPQSLENTLAMLQSRLQHVVVERSYDPNLPTISAYGSELNQVWTNLLENALDAIKNRGRITLRVRRASDLILVEVEDDGPGIPKDHQGRIFEPFFTTKAPGHGLGLGLDTAQRIVRMHRGYLTVESMPGKTCFQVALPLQQTGAY
ncbi:MAG TPA: ATP-binding protein [Acidobacteriaceae bacterium]